MLACRGGEAFAFGERCVEVGAEDAGFGAQLGGLGFERGDAGDAARPAGVPRWSSAFRRVTSRYVTNLL